MRELGRRKGGPGVCLGSAEIAKRSASQPRPARPPASRMLSPVARASAIEPSSSGRTCAYRSAQSRANIDWENHAENGNHGLPAEPAGALSPAASAARELGPDLGGLIRQDGDEGGGC